VKFRLCVEEDDVFGNVWKRFVTREEGKRFITIRYEGTYKGMIKGMKTVELRNKEEYLYKAGCK
jgi:hypothetical protein